MRNGLAVGVDIGGTAIKLGAVDAEGHILARAVLPFQDFPTFPVFADALAESIRSLEREAGRPVVAIGAASPGYPDPATGHLTSGAYNVPILRGQSIIEALQARHLPAKVALNDGVAAAMGEQAFGAASGLSRFALITLGTGVGGCVVIDGKPVVGRNGQPPEIGAMVLDVAGPLCGNGLVGTLEAYASASGFSAAYADAGGDAAASPEQIFAAAAAGDAQAEAAIDATCRRIAQAFGSMINMLNLEACLIGGGISQAGPRLLEGVVRHLPSFTWPPLLRPMAIRLTGTGNTAGLLGAAVAASVGWRRSDRPDRP